MAWGYVQSAKNYYYGTAVTATFANNVVAGNAIIAVVASSWSTAPSSVQDAALNNWTLLGSKATGTGSVWLYGLTVPAGDVGTKVAITATWPNGNAQTIVIQEISGLHSPVAIDGTPGVSSGNTASTGSPAYSSAAAGEYLLCGYGDDSGAITVARINSTWTLDSNSNLSSGSDASIEYKSSTGGAETSGFTGASASGWAVITVAFQLSSGSSGANIHPATLFLSAALPVVVIASIVIEPATFSKGTSFPAVSVTTGTTQYITQIHGTGASGYFATQNGTPRMFLGDTIWNMIPNAGGASSGTWQQDMDNYCNSRGAQGFTAIETCVFAADQNGTNYAYGSTWDGVYPFSSNNDPTTGFNSTFWARVDYFIAACARNGMAAWLNLAYGDAENSTQPGPFYNLTTTQCQAFGAALAARYASTPNIVWQIGGDYEFSFDSLISAMITGIRNGGDTHVISIENFTETTSRYCFDASNYNQQQTWGYSNAQFNSVYSYIQTYYGVRYALQEANPLPVIWCDGYYYKNTSNTYYDPYDRAMRQFVWWALASGARGSNTASESVYPWTAGCAAQVTNEYFYTVTAGHIRTAVESLPNWWKLAPDLGSTLVTAGGGTPVSSDTYNTTRTGYGETFTDSYVTASYAADGSLAMIYLSHASTITVNTALLQSGYTVKWIDPDSGAVYAGTPGSTYNSGATDGSKPILNSAGDADWVLALQGPSTTSINITTPVFAKSSAFHQFQQQESVTLV